MIHEIGMPRAKPVSPLPNKCHTAKMLAPVVLLKTVHYTILVLDFR